MTCSACLTYKAAVNLAFNLVQLCPSPARKTVKSGRKSKLSFAGAVGVDCEELELSGSADRPVKDDLFPVGRPRRMKTEIGNAPQIFAGCAHHINSLRFAFGTKSDALAVGRKCGLRVVGCRILGQGIRDFTADALNENVEFTVRVRSINK